MHIRALSFFRNFHLRAEADEAESEKERLITLLRPKMCFLGSSTRVKGFSIFGF